MNVYNIIEGIGLRITNGVGGGFNSMSSLFYAYMSIVDRQVNILYFFY